MNKKILIINAGSSSIKFKLFDAVSFKVLASGLCERIFIDGMFTINYGDPTKTEKTAAEMKNHTQATEVLLKKLRDLDLVKDLNEIVGIGHRVVQGGEEFPQSTIVTNKVSQAIDDCAKLAPLHNPSELTVIKIFQKLLPKVINLAAFDTSFHTTMPKINYTYPINPEFAKKYLIRRYGAHGTSYKYITGKMKIVLEKSQPNLIICHLGNGASLCAVKAGKSYNTSMGLTPLEGVMMGTRSGDVDPAMATYLIRQGLTPDQVDYELTKNAGFIGLTGSSDLRDVHQKAAAGDEQCQFALQLYTKTISDYIVKYINDLENKVDAIVFTAGVGENDDLVRQSIIDRVFVCKLALDHQRNLQKYADYKLISTPSSTIDIYCMRTDEELMIANDVDKHLSK